MAEQSSAGRSAGLPSGNDIAPMTMIATPSRVTNAPNSKSSLFVSPIGASYAHPMTRGAKS